MQLTKAIKAGLTALILLLCCEGVMAQSSNLGTFSPYSMYGVGELNTPGTQHTRSMGGAGVAMRDMGAINLLNPAAQATVARKSVLFNFGVEGGAYYLSQYASGEDYKTSAYNSYNIRDIAFQLPLASGLGMAVSVTPYSSVGYSVIGSQQVVDVGQINYVYSGTGGINEAKMSLGYRLYSKLSVGIAARYLWGTIQRTFSGYPDVITGNGEYSSTLGTASYTTSKMLLQTGILWTPIARFDKMLSFGLTYNMGCDLNPDVEKYIIGSNSYIETIAEYYTYTGDMFLPDELTAGLSYQNSKITLMADYTFKNWSSRNSGSVNSADGMVVDYTNTSTYKLGIEYIPNRGDIRSYFKRLAYRVGARYGDYYQTYNGLALKEYAVTAGLSIPVKYGSFSKIEVGAEWGSMGSHDIITVSNGTVGMIKQQYIKFSLGLTMFGEDYWFQRVKYE